MRILHRIVIYLIVPLAIAGLLYLNAEIASEKYGVAQPKAGQYLVEITGTDQTVTAEAGEEITIPVTVRNSGSLPWSSGGDRVIFLSYHIHTESGGDTAATEGERTSLPQTVSPGGEATVDLEVSAPEKAGKYTLEIDLVYEGVTWFADQGSETLKLPMEITD